MGAGRRSKRIYPRVIVKGKAEGRITVLYEASLLNISLGGALIEHVQAVRPGTVSTLQVELQGKPVSLRVRVARSVADRTEVQPDGERAVIYHSGLEFVDLPEEMRQVISNYVESNTYTEGRNDTDEHTSKSGESEPDLKGSLLTELEELERAVRETSKKLEGDMTPTEGAV